MVERFDRSPALTRTHDIFNIVPTVLSLSGSVVSMNYLGGLISKVSDQTMKLLLRLGGLILATLGVQILLGGVVRYFGI